MENEIRCLEEITEYNSPENPYIKLYYDKVRFPDGNTGRYNRVEEKEGKPGVLIIPKAKRTPDLLFTYQYRYPVDQFMWELPRGFGESEPLDDAKRELKEETGFEAEDLQCIGKIHPNTGLLSSKIILYLTVLGKGRERKEFDQTNEIVKVKWFNKEEISEMIYEGELTDAITISAIKMAETQDFL